MGLRMNLSLPMKPIYLERHPADQSLMTYSRPKNVTKQISIQNSVSLANVSYSLIVDKTLNIKQIRTTINLKKRPKQYYFKSFY